MHSLSFYRQMRQDCGVRTAIELDGDVVFHRFEAGTPDIDPALLWYVDLRCEGNDLPSDPEQARVWLLENTGPIKEGFRRLAEKLRAGVDISIYPIEWSEFPSSPEGVHMSIVCSTVGRLPSLDLPRILVDIEQHWEDRVRSLPAVQLATH
jgi:hypothetical protein